MTNERVRRMDDLGRIVIPKIIREIVDFREGEPVHIEPLPDNSGVIIRKIKEDSLTDEP